MMKQFYSFKMLFYMLGILLLSTGFWFFSTEKCTRQGPSEEPEEKQFTKAMLAEKLD